MNNLIRRIIFRYTQTSKKFEIVRGKYLIPAPPKRPLSAFMLFSAQFRSKNPGSITETAKKAGQQWKKLSEQDKKKYQEQYKQAFQKYRPQHENYQSKYVQPFKSVSVNNLVTKNYFKNNKTEGSAITHIKQAQDFIAKLSAQQRQKYQKQVAQIRAERQKIRSQYHIPQLQIKTLRAFMMKQAKDKSISDLTQAQRTNLQEKYKKYLEKYQKELLHFGEKFGLSYLDLKDVLTRNQRRIKREKAAEEQAEGLEVQSQTPKKRVVKKIASKSGAKKTVKSAAKKTATGVKRVKKAVVPKKGTKKIVAKKISKKSSA